MSGLLQMGAPDRRAVRDCTLCAKLCGIAAEDLLVTFVSVGTARHCSCQGQHYGQLRTQSEFLTVLAPQRVEATCISEPKQHVRKSLLGDYVLKHLQRGHVWSTPG